ncbi:gliding motility lipoprotein GldH [Flagellimonas meridianipacifica]|uniref:Gliding motility-associated lipoprotein GldH n=1 Tax=Flagellimonas meridianipacifica TaxID=1080225 RepID=A0A2T0MHJ0_9FLAO|nr:gliding motility lipoprotein GldH [Allomuricauda pacifica]PRX57006.1 gliding motility-associated lipoprotein GldH [Allomuricauda pacifica]
MLNRILICLCLLLSLVSCNSKLEFSKFETLKEGSWAMDRPVNFEFSDLDSLQTHNMYINIRNDNNFEFSNLFLITELEYPDGNTQKDTLEYAMAKPTGEWLGKGLGSVKESKLWYREGIVFPDSGVYKVKVTHAMRKNGDIDGIPVLEGITDIGLEIEKISQ